MKTEHLIKNTELNKKGNIQALPAYQDKLSCNLKTMASALTGIENKLNILINNLWLKKLCVISVLFIISLNFQQTIKFHELM
ncbi:MAG: hypothetical protein WC223_11495 [Bacteroidales bacterium]|jgi:hypothetical protein